MKVPGKITFLLCGLLLMLAAFPVFAQNADKNGVMINKRPLMDFSRSVINDLHDQKIDLEASFTVVLSAELSKANGQDTVILANPRILRSEGDPRMRKLVQDGILAVGDGGWFGYLAPFEDVKDVRITVIQDGSEFKASLSAERKNESLAKQIARSFNTLLSIGKMSAEGDDKTILAGTTASSTGKTFTISFTASKKVMIEMVKRRVIEPFEREKENSAARPGNLN